MQVNTYFKSAYPNVQKKHMGYVPPVFVNRQIINMELFI